MIARVVTRSPRVVVMLAAVLLVALGAVAAGTLDALSLNRYEAPGSESVTARSALADLGTGTPNVALLVEAPAGTIDDPVVADAATALAADLAARPGVGDVWSAWSPDAPLTLASEDRTSGLVLAWVPGDADHVRRTVLPVIENEVVGPATADGTVTVTLGGGDEVFRVVAEQARTDFLRAEMIVLPLVGLLLWAVYRRLAPALATLATGVVAVVGALALLRGATTFTEISTFASNIALVMGIGLGVDYGLFMVYRQREELRAGSDVRRATVATVRGAGRTVLFSGVTVAASLAVLLVFPFPFLSSFAYAGVAVVAAAVLASVVVLPAILVLLGHRVLRRSEARRLAGPGRDVSTTGSDAAASGTTDDGHGGRRWAGLATAVMRRPVLAGGAGVLVLLLLGAPALGTVFGAPDDRILTGDHAVRTMYDTVRADYTTEEADAVQVVLPDAGPDVDLSGYASRLSAVPGVLRVDSPAGAFVDGSLEGPPGPDGPARFAPAGSTGSWLSVLPTGERLAADPTGLVAEVRAVEVPEGLGESLVGGSPAELTDYRDGVVERLPLVAVLVAAVTFLVLFVMTGSVVAPVKAIVLNLLSLSVMFGVLVWGFQEGGLSGLLGFEPTGTIEPSIPLLMFCVAYGLSMDYEVFLLARIKEDHDRTGDVVGSVPRGIARSAPLVSAAALVLAASFAVYATSEVTFLQQLGIGMALAVLVDATVVRGVLLPAFMRLAGRANWWAPAPLARWHRRLELGGGPAADDSGASHAPDARPADLVRAP